MEWPLLLVVVAIMLFSGLVHGTLGLGFPMVATPMLAVNFDVRTAILITLLPTVAVNVASIWNSRQSLEGISRFSPLLIFVLFGSIAGTYILASVNPDPFRLALAGLILLYLWSNLSGQARQQWLVTHEMAAMVIFGVLAGLAAGTTNVMVAVLVIFFLSLEIPRARMVGVLNSCFLVGKLSQVAVLSIAGLVGLSLLFETIPLAIAAVLALLFGQRIRAKIAVDHYRNMLHGLLVLLALTLILQYFL